MVQLVDFLLLCFLSLSSHLAAYLPLGVVTQTHSLLNGKSVSS